MKKGVDKGYLCRFGIMLLPSIGIALIVCLIVLFFHQDDTSRKYFVNEIFRKELKTIFFTGFLTLGSFLFAMKSFTLINFKKEIYDSTSYQENYIKDIQIQNLDPKKFLDPLKNLSNLMFIAIFSSILISICQVSLGMLYNFYLTLVCIFMATFSLSVVIFALYWLKRNISVWVSHLETDVYVDILSIKKSATRKLIPGAVNEDRK